MDWSLIDQMYEKFNMPLREHVDLTHLSLDRYHFMLEEVEEFKDAACCGDEAEMLDALVDLQVFLMGSIKSLGYRDVFDAAFAEVMRANLAKEVGRKSTRPGQMHDLIKPKGWTPPNMEQFV